MTVNPHRPLDHIFACLARLDLLIRREVLRLCLHPNRPTDDGFQGLYISDHEVEALLDGSLPSAAILTGPLPVGSEFAALDTAIAALDARIQAIEAEARRQGQILPLDRLSALFALSELERAILIICLAAELDLKYERLYAYLQDDVTKKRPTVDLVMRLLCTTFEERLSAYRAFEPDAPLLHWELITLHDDPGARRPVLLARYLKLDERIASELLGSPKMDMRLAPLVPPVEAESTVPLQPDTCDQLSAWAQAWEQHWAERPPVILFHGRYGTGKRAAARFLAAALQRPLILLSAADLVAGAAQPLALAQALKLAEREALLTGAILCWADADAFLQAAPGAETEYRAFVQGVAQGQVPVVLLADKAWEPGHDLGQRPFMRLELPEPTYAQRRALWADNLNGAGPGLSEAEITALAGRFRLTAGQIQDALARARTLAWARDPQNGHISAADIDAACRGQAQHRLGALARKLNPRYTWDDIVLPRQQLSTLRLIATTVRHRPIVYSDWGFDRKLSLGKGLIALFSGPSGTGKTMAAEIIANDLGLDLYKIDLSAVVSKYIGETEKNLERIFNEAQDSDAILFFDEADALFGKRSEVKDAHDRYANIEVAYLLQRTEEYNGLVILASNIKKNMDEAFIRRLHFTVDFPFPEEAERLEIWRRAFPPEAPRADDIDLGFLARKFKMSGGNIRNVILTAAFLAAEERTPIAMRHLIRGAGYELQKMGKLVVESDFEHYFEIVRT